MPRNVGTGARAVCGLAGLIACSAMLTATPAKRGLTEGRALSRAYDLILDTQFDDAGEELGRICAGKAPAEACQVLRAVARWWRIQLDPDSRALDTEFLEAVNTAVVAADNWTIREPQRAESWFYLGGAYGARVQWRVLRGDKLAAARDGKRIKDALEHAIALDPDLHDAYFGIGLYRYYADVAPAAAKFMRWLLFLPGGDRVQGLSEMLQARNRGALMQGEADYQLHLLYLWYEQKPAQALALLNGLHNRYPHNPLFLQRIAEVQDTYLHDRPASLDTYRALLEAARQDRVTLAPLADVQARLGIATQLDALAETDRAIEHLRTVASNHPDAPYASLSRALWQLGAAYDRLGLHQSALGAYRDAIASAPGDDPFEVRDQARAAMRRRPDPRVADAYRLSLEGWRLVERDALGQAEAPLARAVALDPIDPVIRFRHAKLLQARDQTGAALREFQQVLDARPAAPPPFVAAACLEAGLLLEQSRLGPQAAEMYLRASRVDGADARTREAASRAWKRLQSQSPSARRAPPRAALPPAR